MADKFRKDCPDIPLGEIRGPWDNGRNVQFAINGPNGWRYVTADNEVTARQEAEAESKKIKGEI